MTNTSMTGRLQKLCWLVLLSAVVLLGWRSAKAQTTRQPVLKLRGVPDMLATFEESAKQTGSGGATLALVLREYEKYPRSTIDSLVDGLERLAFTSKHQNARMSAAGTLAVAGWSDRPMPGALDRVLGAYRRSDDALVRGTILGRMQLQHERGRAIAFLESVAVEDLRKQDFPQASLQAVSTLSHMGEEGRSALMKLRDNGTLRDPNASGFVDWYFRSK